MDSPKQECKSSFLGTGVGLMRLLGKPDSLGCEILMGIFDMALNEKRSRE
jgi:hypothetical protein